MLLSWYNKPNTPFIIWSEVKNLSSCEWYIVQMWSNWKLESTDCEENSAAVVVEPCWPSSVEFPFCGYSMICHFRIRTSSPISLQLIHLIRAQWISIRRIERRQSYTLSKLKLTLLESSGFKMSYSFVNFVTIQVSVERKCHICDKIIVLNKLTLTQSKCIRVA